jgi:hypothetical protein
MEMFQMNNNSYGLKNRTHLLLFRSGLTLGKERMPDVEKLLGEVGSETIVFKQGFGKKTIEELKNWLQSAALLIAQIQGP